MKKLSVDLPCLPGPALHLMEKRNVVEDRRTPEVELTRSDEDWDKAAAAEMVVQPPAEVKAPVEKPA